VASIRPDEGGRKGEVTSGWQIPPEFTSAWSSRPWWQRHWRLLVMLAIVAVIVAIYAFLFLMLGQMMAVPTQRIDAELSEGSNGRILNTLFVPPGPIGGRGGFILMVAPDVTAADASILACSVVRPVLAREGYQATTFSLVTQKGATLASNATACP
jgi:hypothetical protein